MIALVGLGFSVGVKNGWLGVGVGVALFERLDNTNDAAIARMMNIVKAQISGLRFFMLPPV